MFPSGVLLPAVILATIGHAQGCGCPTNWVFRPHNDRCYFSSIKNGTQTETYFGARRRCQKGGGDLAIMADETEYHDVRTGLHDQTSYDRFWIGACWGPDMNSFKYVNGSAVPDWVKIGTNIARPPAFGAVMISALGVVLDGDPYSKHQYVCKKELCAPSVQTAWCNEPKTSTVSYTDSSTDTISSTAKFEQTSSVTINDIPRPTLVTMKHTPDGLDVTGPAVSTNTPESPDDEGMVIIYIGIGVGVFLILVIVCVLIACIICRKRRSRKSNSDYPQENNLNMDIKHTDQPLTNNMLTGHTNPSDKLTYEESGYAEVDGQPNEAVPGKSVPAKDLVYDTATAVDIGVARKQDTNDVALYATPVRVRGNAEKEKDDDSSDEESTQIVENTIYGE